MDEGNLPILVDAKTEYTKQLINIIYPVIYQGIKLIYNESKNKSIENEESNCCLLYFQNELSEIPKWNQITIIEKYNKVLEYSKCDWLEDLLTAVFVSHTKILTSINTNKNKNKINLQIPKVDFFIHQCYIEVAREFWKNPYLFDDNVNNFEYQRNRRDATQIIENIIGETIRKQLPVKNILKEYLGNEYNEENNDNIESSSNITDNLRKLVKNEIENCSKEKLSSLNIEQPKSENDDNILTKEDLNDFNNTTLENLGIDSEDKSNKDKYNEDKSNKDKSNEDKSNEDKSNEDKSNEEKSNEDIIDQDGTSIKINKVNNNDIKLDNIDDLINNEVDKLELVSPNDYELNAKNIDDNLSKEFSDLSQLEEVYIDDNDNKSLDNTFKQSNEEIKNDSQIVNEKINTNLNKDNLLYDLNTNNEENIKLDINNTNELEELNLDSLDDFSFDINNLDSNILDTNQNNILDTNQNNILDTNQNNILDTNQNNILDTNQNNNFDSKQDNNIKTIVIDTKHPENYKKYDNDKSLEINNDSPRKKILNKYSSKRKKDFSFFNDALSE